MERLVHRKYDDERQMEVVEEDEAEEGSRAEHVI